MTYLLYCIFRGPFPKGLEIPDGVAGQRVFTANHRGLGVALSQFDDPDWHLDASSLLAYASVVESLYRHVTVVPIRYGCVVGDVYDAAILLRDNYAMYRQLLARIEGLAEVGIHVIAGDAVAGAEYEWLSNLPGLLPAHFGVSEAVYPDAKRISYGGIPMFAKLHENLAERLCNSLEGSFLRHKVEFSTAEKGSPVSLHFLVRCESAPFFCRTALNHPVNQTVKLFLSGPKPPYNFVDTFQP